MNRYTISGYFALLTSFLFIIDGNGTAAGVWCSVCLLAWMLGELERQR